MSTETSCHFSRLLQVTQGGAIRKFGFNRPSGFRGDDVWKCWQHTHIHIHTDDRAYLYYKLTYKPIQRLRWANKKCVFWHPMLNKIFHFYDFYVNYIHVNCYILKSIHVKTIKSVWKFIRIVLLFISESFAGLKPSITRPRENQCSNLGGIQVHPQLFLIK